ncbi:hypothetical protein LCM20_08860 [Halobacillus litoralis]|uniref:hypothetical protein n=1 Tax=Halobacillus litoralis TaxID=45668 RepID=UPI001CD6190E|nr:hypothetical protein [Halobacillus litoralis]MCA0970696.1 hypothetical protein [Halobacillus litoralis]
MHKIYLSIIALLVLLVAFLWTSPEDTPPVEEEETASGEVDPLTFYDDYFSGIKPKEGLFANRKSAAIDLDLVPSEEKKSYAAALLLEARVSMNAEREIVFPTQDQLASLFSPTDLQLQKLQEDENSELAEKIAQSYIQVRQAGKLVEDDRLREHLYALSKQFSEIEPYRKENLYDFSVAFYEYRDAVEQLVLITDSFDEGKSETDW